MSQYISLEDLTRIINDIEDEKMRSVTQNVLDDIVKNKIRTTSSGLNLTCNGTFLESVDSRHLGSLGCVEIPEGVREIEEKAFMFCYDMTKVTIPSTVTKIPTACFYGCTNLKTVILPPTLEEIGKETFRNCCGLEEIIIPSTLKKIDEMAFDHCENLKRIIISENSQLETIGHCAFDDCISLQEIILPNSLKEIGAASFFNCQKLENINIPKSVKIIGSNAFVLTPIKSRYIPESVEKINYSICCCCRNLEKITIDKNNKNYSDMNCNIIYKKDENAILQGCCNSIIPEETETILSSAFYGMTLKQNNINNKNIKVIDDRAFSFSNIASINLTNVNIIGNAAFTNCKNLQERIEFNSKNQAIGWHAFENSNVKTIKFSKNTKIDEIQEEALKDSNIDMLIFESKDTLKKESDEDELSYLEILHNMLPEATIIIEDIINYPELHNKYKNILKNSALEYQLESKGFTQMNSLFNEKESPITNEISQTQNEEER